MAGGGYKDGGSAISEINVTPLVDVVLVLLVIFMVTAPMIAAQGILVDSPEASTGEPVQSSLNLSIAKDGTLGIKANGDEFTFAAEKRAEAATVLTRQHRENPDIRAVIAGDRGVPHGDVIEVIDMVRAAGIDTFALRTKSRVAPVEDDSVQ